MSTDFTVYPTNIATIVAFAGYKATSLISYNFNDKVSVLQTLPTDSADFCGSKNITFTFNGAPTTTL